MSREGFSTVDPFLFSHILPARPTIYTHTHSDGVNDASYWPRKNASGKYWMDSQCNWLNGSSKARKEERRGGVFFWVYVTPRVRPDITEQIEAESCSYPAVCSAAPRECGLLPSSQQTISLSPSLLLALFSSSSRLSCTTETLPFSSIDPAVPFLFSRLSPLPSSYTASWPVLQSQATPDLTPPGRNSQPCHSSQSSTRPLYLTYPFHAAGRILHRVQGLMHTRVYALSSSKIGLSISYRRHRLVIIR